MENNDSALYTVPCILPEELEIGELIGYDHFGKIYKGFYCGRAVTIKCYHRPSRTEFFELVEQDFDVKKIKVPKRLESLYKIQDDQFFEPLYGIMMKDSVVYIITKQFPETHRNLLEWLKFTFHGDHEHKGLKEIPMENILKIAKNTAKGILHIHKYTDYRHAYIRPDNLLIWGLGNVIISFPPIDITGEDAGDLTCNAGEMKFLAPEQLLGTGFPDFSADVYTFALVMVLLLTYKGTTDSCELKKLMGRKPMDEFDIDFKEFEAKLRPGIVSTCLWKVFKQCLNKDPKNRPSISDVYDRLEKITPYNLDELSESLDAVLDPLEEQMINAPVASLDYFSQAIQLVQERREEKEESDECLDITSICAYYQRFGKIVQANVINRQLIFAKKEDAVKANDDQALPFGKIEILSAK